MRAFGRLLISLLLLAPPTAPALAIDYAAGPDDYRGLLGQLRPGDRLLLRAGDYLRGLPLHRLSGEPGKPIVIAGEPGTRFLARPGQNTLSLLDVSHLTIRDLELDGRNLPVDAVKAEGHGRYAHFITLENLHIHDHAASQQNVGISSKCPAYGWVVRGNRIERVGTGMYFGDSDGSDPFVAGRIENNRIIDTIGYSLQIKHQNARPTDMPAADERHDTIIRGNLFAKEAAWPDPAARPNVLVGHAPLTGPGSRDRVLVYGNVFWQNPSEALFQGEGHLVIYNNVFVNAQGHAVHLQPHHDVPRYVDVFHNTIVARGNGIRILRREGTAPVWSQRLRGNLVFAARPLSGGEASDNLAGDFEAAARFLKQPFAEPERLDLAPRVSLAAMAHPEFAAYPDADKDIDGRARNASMPGACAGISPCPAPRHGR